MSTDDTGNPYGNAQQPGIPLPPGYQQYGQAQPGYQQQAFQPGYQPSGFPPGPPGWGAPPPDLKVGTVPLRPLDLGALYSGAFAAIRSNPGVMIGMTAVVVVISQLVTFLAQIPLTAIKADDDSDDAAIILTSVGASAGVSFMTAMFSMIATLIVCGMLTVVVSRSVLGERTRAAVAWRTVAPRILRLIALALLQFLIYFIPALLVVGIVVLAAIAAGDAGPVAAVAVGLVLGIALLVGYFALWPALTLAAPALVLERLGPIAAIRRGFVLQKSGFWRLLGILLLTSVLAGIVVSIVSVPAGVGSVLIGNEDGVRSAAGNTVAGLALMAVAGVIGQIITMPFVAAVQTLLYVDQRMRVDAIYQVLRAEAAHRIQAGRPGVSTEDLWLYNLPAHLV